MSNPSNTLRTLTVIVMLVIAAYLLIGGVWLIVLGGSIYYGLCCTKI